jgi:cytochrome b561
VSADALPTRYSGLQKALHWGIAALIVTQVPLGLWMVGLGFENPLTGRLYELHKSFGLVVFGLALWRIAVRWRRGVPALDPTIPGWQRRAADISHYALYLLIVLVPLTGWIATSMCCRPVNLFWTVPLTFPVPPDGEPPASKAVFTVHYGLAFTLTAIVLIHIGAALQHHLLRRDDTLRRMLPGGR